MRIMRVIETSWNSILPQSIAESCLRRWYLHRSARGAGSAAWSCRLAAIAGPDFHSSTSQIGVAQALSHAQLAFTRLDVEFWQGPKVLSTQRSSQGRLW